MSKLIQRLLTFFIGLPVVIGLVCLHQYHHLALHLVIIAVSVCAAIELHGIFSCLGCLQHKAVTAFMSALPPVMALCASLLSLPYVYVDFVFVGAVLLSLALEVITAETFEHSNLRLLSSSFIVFYSGYLPTFIVRMTAFEHATEYIALFLVLVFMCDSLAWLFGNLFGKNNRGFIKASPNKSIAGFAGGILGSVASALLARFLLPEVFTFQLLPAGLLGLFISLCAIVGDLAESVFKRSAHCKDSGAIIPGRGGILDSIDSVVFAAPVFYVILTVLNGTAV